MPVDHVPELALALALVRRGQIVEAELILAAMDDSAFVPQPVVSAARRLCATANEHREAAELHEGAARHERDAESSAQEQLAVLLSGAVEPRASRFRSLLHRRPDRSRRKVAPDVEMTPRPVSTPQLEELAPLPAAPHEEAAPTPPQPESKELVAGAPPEPVDLGPADAEIEVRLLGSLGLVIAGRRVTDWGSHRGRSVLQYLLLHADRPCRREILMDTFWPGHSYESARNNLNVALYAVRRAAFGEGDDRVSLVLHREGCYLLNSELDWWIDRDAFLAGLTRGADARRLGQYEEATATFQAAAELYRGRLFEDDPVCDWFIDEQRNLEERYLDLLESIARLLLEQGDDEGPIRLLQRALLRDPCRESAHRLVMECYGRQQQHHLVTRQFRICEDRLKRELDIEPAPETVRLFRSLTGPRS
ncbi:MAG: BTAD domain-containing putative transcriptional regulator [Acidimicrobiia bacterium]